MLQDLLAAEPATAIWAHGLLPAAEAFAQSVGLGVTRDLWLLRRDLAVPIAGTLAPPESYTVRDFAGPADGPDGTALIAANAVIFADHPEQGAFQTADLARRMAEPWFDPTLLRLVFGPAGDLAAYGWLKPAPLAAPGTTPEPAELYLLGVSAAHRRRGLAAWLIADALRSALSRGAPAVTLYVEGVNQAAIRSYLDAGFIKHSHDVQFSAQHERWVNERAR